MNQPRKTDGQRHEFEVNDLYITVYENNSFVQSLDVSYQTTHTSNLDESHWLAPLIQDRFRTSICVPWNRLSLDHLTDFQRAVLTALDDVPAGQTLTYGKLADRIDRPRAARAVGQALKQNPYPILLPCHRVVRQDGSVGGYGGTGESSLKRRLLSIEGVKLEPD